MSPEAYAHVSNLLVPTATVIYFLAMAAHTLEWALGRAVVTKTAALKQEVLVASDGEEVSTGRTDTVALDAPVASDRGATASTERMEAASRVGLLLTWLGFVLHLGGVVT